MFQATILATQNIGRFEIIYTDPESGEEITEIKDFYTTEFLHISAYEWAEDYAYSRADKGKYLVCARKGDI